jgi:hypothetical protein
MISSELSLKWFAMHKILTRDLGMRKRPMSHGSFHQCIFGRQKQYCGSLAPVTSFYSLAQKQLENVPFLFFG